MLKLNLTTQFKRNYNINLLNDIVNTLRIPAALPSKNKDHVLYLDRTGTHSDLFGE